MERKRVSLLNKFSSHFSLNSTHKGFKISIIVYTVLSIIVVDTILNQTPEMRLHLDNSGFSVTLFVIMGTIVIGGQFYILEYVRQKSNQIRKKVSYIQTSYKVAFVIQYLIISLFAFVIFEIIIIQQYPPVALALVTIAAYGLTIGLMATFTVIFFSWYKSNRKSFVVLLYGISFAAVVSASVIFITGSFLFGFVGKPLYITSEGPPSYTPAEPGSLRYQLGKWYHYSDIASFLLKWIATAFLLYHYAQKMGKVKYWILISLPLVYFAGTYMDDYHIYEPHTEIEELYWDTYTSLNSTAGGILFYMGFVVAARHFHGNMAVKDYLIMCGFGFLLFFSAGQSTLASTLYPPFGLATMSLYGLTTYMILLGLYSTAKSISQDNQLRKTIRKIATHESKLLDCIGTAQMEREIQNTVNGLKSVVGQQENELEKQSGIEAGLEQDEMKDYLEQVMHEVGKVKKPSSK